jgi:hypothetical protein
MMTRATEEEHAQKNVADDDCTKIQNKKSPQNIMCIHVIPDK